MAGGIGTRLYPMSTPEHPKQFIDVLDCGRSLIQLTVDRFLPLCPPERFWVVTSERYRDDIARQLPDIPASHILLEPVARNTAPCIAYACRRIAAECPDASVVVTPSDAYVEKTALFAATIRKALDFVESSEEPESIVTVGITPTRPETGYGYIHLSRISHGVVVPALEFREKPDAGTAECYLASGDFVWNAGIFVWRVAGINSLLRRFTPGIAEIMDALEPHFNTPSEQQALGENFPLCEKISIDYAVLEKAPYIYTVADELGWDDLGSWTSVFSHLERLGKQDKIDYWREKLQKIPQKI